jgi:hypothetical protein
MGHNGFSGHWRRIAINAAKAARADWKGPIRIAENMPSGAAGPAPGATSHGRYVRQRRPMSVIVSQVTLIGRPAAFTIPGVAVARPCANMIARAASQRAV